MIKDQGNWGDFLERLLTAVLLTSLLGGYQQAFPLKSSFSFSQTLESNRSLISSSRYLELVKQKHGEDEDKEESSRYF